MKKYISAVSLLMIIACISLAGCGVTENYEKAVWDTTEYEGVSAIIEDVSSIGLTATLDDTTENEFAITGWAHIQIQQDHEWYEVKKIQDIVSAASASDGDSNDSFVIDWSESYGELPEGDYRIGLIFEGNIETNTTLSTWGYFSIK